LEYKTTGTVKMNEDINLQPPESPGLDTSRNEHTIGSSSIYRLCEEIIALREITNRQHRMFEQTLTKTRDAVQTSFNNFAADTQRAYQQLRQEFHGEKRASLALLNELVEIAFDMQRIIAARPASPSPPGGVPLGTGRGSGGTDLRAAHEVSGTDQEAFARWAEAVEVEARKVEAALLRHGIHPYNAVIGSPYNPALHERVGSQPVEGMGPLLVAEQQEPGWASQQPEFVLRRPKVIVSE
jgi:molecular chaperone GrpE (heat shock protein)